MPAAVGSHIAYEENDPLVVKQLQAAYPRFCIHPDVAELCHELFPQRSGLPFATSAAAGRAVEYVQHAGGRSAVVQPIAGQPCAGVAIDDDELPLLRQYWQHAGEIVSSRMARAILAETPVEVTQNDSRLTVRQRVAELHQTSADNVYLYPSGMAAVAGVWRAIVRLSSGRPTCQFGFPYVDTLKIQQRFPEASHEFLPVGSSGDEETLTRMFPERKFAAVLCETPTNPLLVTPDLSYLREITARHGSLLVVDDTLRACCPQTILPSCDAVVTSLTKYFSGYGNVLAGALVLNSESVAHEILRSSLDAEFEESLSDLDTEILELNSRDLAGRTAQCVRNAQVLSDRLRQHPAVAQVFFPEYSGDSDTSCGALFSVLLKNAANTTPGVFDQLQVSKGPNLGTRFSLCCPYTILAHYRELDFAERCGVSRWLLRFSVGIEPVEDLWHRFVNALETVRTIQ